MNTPPRLLPALAALGLLAAGCRSTRPTPSPEPLAPRDWALQSPDAPAGDPHTQPAPWWDALDDPILRDLLQRARRQNRDLHVARARIRRARALQREAGAAGRPRLSATADLTRSDPGRTANRDADDPGTREEWDAGLAADWEIDVFGRVASRLDSADARRRVQQEQQRHAHLQVASEVALAYYEIRGVRRQRAITEANLDLLRKTLELAQKLFDSGERSEFDVVRARGQLELIQVRLPELDARIHTAASSLAALVAGDTRTLLQKIEAADADAPLPAPRLPPLPSDLLRQRPDLRAAAEGLKAATSDADAARADRFPRFSLLGEIGRRSESASDLSNRDSDRHRIGIGLDWPIWEGGALRARQDIREAEVEEALALYERDVLQAFAEVETALARYLRERDIRNRLREAEASSLRAVDLARNLYNAGEEDFLAVLDAERELISIQDSLAISETRVVQNRIRLYTALGGGWGPPSAQ